MANIVIIDVNKYINSNGPKNRGHQVITETSARWRLADYPPITQAASPTFCQILKFATSLANRRRDQLTGTSKIGRGSLAPGPSKCHHSPEYTDSPPACIADRNSARFACCTGETPSVA